MRVQWSTGGGEGPVHIGLGLGVVDAPPRRRREGPRRRPLTLSPSAGRRGPGGREEDLLRPPAREPGTRSGRPSPIGVDVNAVLQTLALTFRVKTPRRLGPRRGGGTNPEVRLGSRGDSDPTLGCLLESPHSVHGPSE